MAGKAWRERHDLKQEESMNTGPVVVEGAQEFRGVRVDHPSILASIRNCLTMGYGNEHICRIIGVPGEVVDKERAKFAKLKS